MNLWIIISAISLVVSVAVAIKTSKSKDTAEDDFSNPTAEEGRPFGRIAGKVRCTGNTIYFNQTGTSAVKSDGK